MNAAIGMRQKGSTPRISGTKREYMWHGLVVPSRATGLKRKARRTGTLEIVAPRSRDTLCTSPIAPWPSNNIKTFQQQCPCEAQVKTRTILAAVQTHA